MVSSAPAQTAALTSCSRSIPLTTSDMVAGHKYAIKVIGVDSAGNAANSFATWIYDTTGPVIGLTISGKLRSNVTSCGLSVSGSTEAQVANYNASPWTHQAVTGVERSLEKTAAGLYWKGSSWVADPTTTTSASDSSPWSSWSWSIAGANMTNGDQYTLSAMATDAAPNTGSTNPVSFTSHAQAPV
jgi:hypothetical protein